MSARDEAAALYPYNGTDPSIVLALRSAYRAGAEREGRAALDSVGVVSGSPATETTPTVPDDDEDDFALGDCRSCGREMKADKAGDCTFCGGPLRFGSDPADQASWWRES